MTLTNKAIKDFQELYRDDYGISLEFEEAKKMAIAFMVQMSAVYKPIPQDHFNNYNNDL
jgi:hypothetical protein